MAEQRPSLLDRVRRHKTEQNAALPPVDISPSPEPIPEEPPSEKERLCPACKKRKKQAAKEVKINTALKQKRREEQAAQQAAGQAKREEKRRRQKLRAELHGRLPDGAHFSCTWLAGRHCWTGTLTIQVNDTPITFSATATALFRLNHDLDMLYREWAGLLPKEEVKHDA